MNICGKCGAIIRGKGKKEYCAECSTVKPKRKINSNERAIAEVALKARLAGMTYGRYVATNDSY